MLLEQHKKLKKNNKTTVTFSKQSVLFSIDNKIHCIKTKKYDGCDYMTTIVTKIILGYLNNEWKTQQDFQKIYTTEIINEYGDILFEKIYHIIQTLRNGKKYVLSYLYTQKHKTIDIESLNDLENIIEILHMEIIRIKKINLLQTTIYTIEKSYL